MDHQSFSFSDDSNTRPNKGPVAVAPVELIWRFNASQGLDRPFHALVSRFGSDVLMDLDQIVLDSPIKAAIRATKVYQNYSSQMGGVTQTREVMQHIASVLKPNENLLDDEPLLPPEAVFYGFERPRG